MTDKFDEAKARLDAASDGLFNSKAIFHIGVARDILAKLNDDRDLPADVFKEFWKKTADLFNDIDDLTGRFEECKKLVDAMEIALLARK